MAISKLKQIKDVVRNFDVRDPTGAMIAIEGILKSKVQRTGRNGFVGKRVLKIEVFDNQERGEMQVDVKGLKTVEPHHILGVKQVIKDILLRKQAEERAESGEVGVEGSAGDDDCDCPACNLRRALDKVIQKVGDRIAETKAAEVKKTDSGSTQGCD